MLYDNIYVISPYGLVTGGPDALHQLVYYMNRCGLKAHMVYSDIRNKRHNIPNQYEIYIKEYMLLNDIVDSSKNVLIVPETLTNILDKYEKINKYIWWLSVQNDTNATFMNKILIIMKKIFRKQNIKSLYKINTLRNVIHHKKYDFPNNKVIHLCASYYAYDYVIKKTKNVKLFIEPISKLFLENIQDNPKKEEYILYNPKKNYAFTKKIMNKNRDLFFVPLSGYTQSQLIDLYSKCKLYIDFGNFPGAERIPKEAVLNGCCIITGRYGASSFYDDVPIKDEYKFDAINDNIDNISNKIRYCLQNYEKIKSDFDQYRVTVLKLENEFIKKIIEYFC